MTIPKYDEFFTDVLEVLSDGKAWRSSEMLKTVVDRRNLSSEERNESLSGGKNKAENRAYWAALYLYQAGATTRPSRGIIEINDLGRQLLRDHPSGVLLLHVEAMQGFKDWIRRQEEAKALKRKNKYLASTYEENPVDSDIDPTERIDNAVEQLRATVAADLLQQIRAASPTFFETAVLSVLHSLGYGANEDDLEHLGGGGPDGGVDGVINQDTLGLDQIYVQAKRYQEGNSIGAPVVQAFSGAISGKKASRGIFITTSQFTKDARDFALGLNVPRIRLIDGSELARLMLDLEVGVTVERIYKVYKIDENFFED